MDLKIVVYSKPLIAWSGRVRETAMVGWNKMKDDGVARPVPT